MYKSTVLLPTQAVYWGKVRKKNTKREQAGGVRKQDGEREDTRFAATVVDVLRHMPPETRHEGRRTVYNIAVDVLLKALITRQNVHECPLYMVRYFVLFW